jgi:two-component system, cell cycle sensor histidine kinase and response regulator CckA
MGENIRVLIVEDDPADAELMVRHLQRGGFAPDWVRVETESDYLSSLLRAPEVILSDSNLPHFDGLRALDLLSQRGLDIPFVLVSGRMGEDWAVDAMKRGADDYLGKDRLARLGEAVRRAIEQRRLRSEKTWAMEALRQSEERYRLVSEITSDYAYSLSVEPSGSFTCEWITEPFTRITGFSAADINAAGWMSLYHPEDWPILERRRQILLANRSDSSEVRIVTKDGEVRWVRVYGRPLWNENQQRVVCIYGAAQDITAQKQLEQQLLQSQKMEAIGRLAGGVAHDFNNLLTAIMGSSDLMMGMLPEGEELWTCASEILKAGERAAGLTRQLLAFSRRQVFSPCVADINFLVKNMERMLSRLIGGHIPMTNRLVPGSLPVKIDPGQFEQILLNLVVNSRDAMPGGGKIVAETSRTDVTEPSLGHPAVAPGSYAVLSVSDTGSGMDAATKAHIFEPFFTTKERGKGTGLGLSTVFGIVQQSGGYIAVYSEVGRGTTFKIYLPLTAETVTPMPSQPAAPPHESGGETILLVEDDAVVRRFAGDALRRRGYQVLEAADAAEAKAIFATPAAQIDLILTDVIMPGINGLELAAELKRMHPGLKVMYMSGYTDHALANTIEVGPAMLLQKPFTATVLERAVRDTLDLRVASA